MPNWCYSKVHFEGDIKNITKLTEDIYKAIDYTKKNHYEFCNISYFFSLSGFNVDSYLNRFGNNIYGSTNFRGTIFANYPLMIYYYGDYAIVNVDFETAWYMDYDILYLISMLYNVKFSAYSEEPSMDVFTKCSNAEIGEFDYDYVIRPDCEQLENHNENSEVEFDYTIPVKDGDDNSRLVMDALSSFSIEYEKVSIQDESDRGSTLYGVYYDTKE